jgi:hypothetical protein
MAPSPEVEAPFWTCRRGHRVTFGLLSRLRRCMSHFLAQGHRSGGASPCLLLGFNGNVVLTQSLTGFDPNADVYRATFG